MCLAFQVGGSMSRKIFLRVHWYHSIPSAVPPQGISGHPYRAVWSGRSAEKLHQNSRYGLPTVLNGEQALGGHIRVVDDQGGNIIQGTAYITCPVPVVCDGPGGGVIGGAPPDPAWYF